MSSRFVRVSKFRHVFGDEPKKPDERFSDLQKPLTSGEANYIACSTKFFAVAKAGGGGPVYVHALDQLGRFDINHPVVNVNRSAVLDMDFHAFNPNILATASDDCSIGITAIPDGGLTESITEPLALLKGHAKKLALVHWHPTANNILGSSSYDRTIKVWDVVKQEEALTFSDFGDNVFSFEWSNDGSQIFATCKDGHNRIFDPRSGEAVITFAGHESSKVQRGFWVPNLGLVGSVGFTNRSKRVIKGWDIRAPEKAAHTTEMDQGAGVFAPFYDEDLSVLYLAGRGEQAIRYFEFDDSGIHSLSEFRAANAQKGVDMLPKRACDTHNCEIARFYRLTNKRTVEFVSMRVPRQQGSDIFQEDIYPDTYAGVPALEGDAWLAGENKPAPQVSFKDLREGNVADSATEMRVEKSRDQLQEELVEANQVIEQQAAKIKELTEQLAKMK